MKNVSLKIDGIMLLTVAAAGVVAYGYYRRDSLGRALNPADQENLVNSAVVASVGQENITRISDYIFGAVDLINPFNKSDLHARSVYGLNSPLVADVQSEGIAE